MNYVILSDIHANYLALQAVQEKIDQHYNSEEIQFVFLGDLLGYGPLEGAQACVEWFSRQKTMLTLPGNHDEWIATSMNQISQVSNGARVSLLAQRAFLEQSGLDRVYFESVITFLFQPRKKQLIECITGSKRIFFTHGGFSSEGLRLTYLYPWASGQIQMTLKTMRDKYIDQQLVLICGHTHFPMAISLTETHLRYYDIPYEKPIQLGECVILNGGSIGQPRDGDPRASFCVYNDVEHTVTFFRVEYDLKRFVRMLLTDRNYAAGKHKLNSESREKILDLVGGIENVDKGYESLIQRIQTGDGGTELAKYQSVYQRTEFGLKALI